MPGSVLMHRVGASSCLNLKCHALFTPMVFLSIGQAYKGGWGRKQEERKEKKLWEIFKTHKKIKRKKKLLPTKYNKIIHIQVKKSKKNEVRLEPFLC